MGENKLRLALIAFALFFGASCGVNARDAQYKVEAHERCRVLCAPNGVASYFSGRCECHSAACADGGE